MGLRGAYAHSVVTEEAFVPHTPDRELSGTAIVYAVRLDYFGKMSKSVEVAHARHSAVPKSVVVVRIWVPARRR